MTKLLKVEPGLINIDSLVVDNNQRSFIPKTVSWIPGAVLIDNAILYRYFLDLPTGEEYDRGKWSKLFDLNNRSFKSNGFQFTGKFYTDGLSCNVLLQAEGYTNGYQKKSG